MSRPAERVVTFYNRRGTAEQWIKEGKNAIKWTRLSCCSFVANAVRPQLHALAYNLENLHADAGSAGGSQAMVADEPAGKAREDRRQDRAPWPLRHLPDGRGRGAEGIVPANPAADRWTATKTSPSVATGEADASSRRKEWPGCREKWPDRQIGHRSGRNKETRTDAWLRNWTEN